MAKIEQNKLMFSPFPHFVTARRRTIQQIEFGDTIHQNWMFALFLQCYCVNYNLGMDERLPGGRNGPLGREFVAVAHPGLERSPIE